MPRFYPNTRFSDCWASVGNVTFYHRDGICYFRSKAYSEFAGTAEQLGNEHVPVPQAFVPFPIFSLDYSGCSRDGEGGLSLAFRLTLCGTEEFSRYRVLCKVQLEEPGMGRNPGKMRNFLSTSIPSETSSEISVTIKDYQSIWGLSLDTYQLHLRYILLDTATGYRSQYHSLSTLISFVG